MSIKLCFAFLIALLFAFNANSSPVLLKLDSSEGNKGNLEFALQLPNNDTVQIDLSFKLLTISKPLNETKDDVDGDNFTAAPITTTTKKPESKYVTVQEAIEGFRQELIKREKEIAGIIESEQPFYRHFKLEFNDDTILTIRCTYDSNYSKRSLNISCYEYHEYETERILSNGEVEMIRLQDTTYETDVEYIDARNVKQLYTMEIS